jgi:hypothetical protein
MKPRFNLNPKQQPPRRKSSHVQRTYLIAMAICTLLILQSYYLPVAAEFNSSNRESLIHPVGSENGFLWAGLRIPVESRSAYSIKSHSLIPKLHLLWWGRAPNDHGPARWGTAPPPGWTAPRSDTYAFGIHIPYWLLLTVFASLWLRLTVRNRRAYLLEHQAGHCHVCDYDLRASSDRCPECGTPILAGDANPRGETLIQT